MNSRSGGLKPGETEIAVRGREIAEALLSAVGEAAAFYAELAPDGRELSGKTATRVRAHQTALAVCLRDIQSDHDVIAFLAEHGERVHHNLDMRPTISLARMMQRSFGLASSKHPARRVQAMPAKEMAKFAAPIYRFWRDF